MNFLIMENQNGMLIYWITEINLMVISYGLIDYIQNVLETSSYIYKMYIENDHNWNKCIIEELDVEDYYLKKTYSVDSSIKWKNLYIKIKIYWRWKQFLMSCDFYFWF